MTTATDVNTLLIDRYMSRFDFTRREQRFIDMPSDLAYQVVRSLDLLEIHSPLMDAAMWIRTLPGRLRGTAPPPPPTMRLGDLFDEATAPTPEQPWVGLAETRGRELVFGVVGKFWQSDIEWNPVPSEVFEQFDEPGWGKIVASISVHNYGASRSIIVYEARTTMTDPDSRRRFGRYWGMVSPFVGIVMRSLLAEVGRRAPQT